MVIIHANTGDEIKEHAEAIFDDGMIKIFVSGIDSPIMTLSIEEAKRISLDLENCYDDAIELLSI